MRPRGAAIEQFADLAATELGERHGDVRPETVEEGLSLLSARERRRLVACWVRPYPDRWRRICATLGDRQLAERMLAGSAVRALIADRRGAPRARLAALEDGNLQRSPAAAVALAIAPQSVWAYEEAFAAARAAGNPRNKDWYERVERYAAGAVAKAHEQRVREHAARLQGRLPLDGLPRASSTLDAGCERVASRPGIAAGVATVLLAAYVAELVLPPSPYRVAR